MVDNQGVFCETPDVTVSGTTEAERKAEGSKAPAAELEGALKMIRALGERVTERVNQNLPRMQMLERRLIAAQKQRVAVDEGMCSSLTQIRQVAEEVAEELRKFQEFETMCVRTTPIGDVADLEASSRGEPPAKR